MGAVSTTDLVIGLVFMLSAVGSILMGTLAWLGNKMYDKLQVIEQLFLTNLSDVTNRFAAVENRITRLETQADNIKDRCSLLHHIPTEHTGTS